MNNSFFSKFGPKEPKFFDFLKQVSETLLETSDFSWKPLRAQPVRTVRNISTASRKRNAWATRLSHKIFEKLSTSFITPFDREDIHLLADNLDDVIDRINSCAKRIAIYNPKKNNPYEKPSARLSEKTLSASMPLWQS
jgi:uncharacterized protein Yka (UPF0111/DUF47 family)